MRTSWIVALLALELSGTWACAQDKVAEGEYQSRGISKQGTPISKTATRWVLYGMKPGGYRLESEILNLPGRLRLVQTEELNNALAPAAMGYELYKNDEKEPGITVNCKISPEAITCGGTFEKQQVPASAPYKQEGPFSLLMEDFYVVDFQWLMEGTVSLAHPEGGKTKVPTVSVLGGTAVLIGDAVNVANLQAVKQPQQNLVVVASKKPTEWELYSNEESLVEMVGAGTVEVDGVKVAARHYTFTNGDNRLDLWIAGSGVPVKLDAHVDAYVLVNYKQYKRLIPELPVVDHP
jgi:hypothetical protein